MSKRSGSACFLLLAAVFLLLNRAAYGGYFSDDDICSLQWTRWAPSFEYLKGALNPVYQGSFRAVGFFYYHLGGQLFGLDFPKYVAVLHCIHLANVWLLWLLLRRLGTPVRAACAGCVFFGLHMALFDAVWKPAFVFDVLCAFFCLLSLLLWARGNWILSFFAFWLAYRSKELAVMLPIVLLCYTLWFGQRHWKRLVPFLAASLSFSVQALLLKPDNVDGYTFHFTTEALSQTVPFYAGRVFLVPYLGFLLPFAAARNRRAWLGLAMTALFFVPLVFLPGRVLSAYCYLPFTGLAVLLAGVLEQAKPAVIAILFLLWTPLELESLRSQRNDTLRQDADARRYIAAFGRYAKTRSPANHFVARGLPEGFLSFGAEGTVKYFLPAADLVDTVQDAHTAVLRWDPAAHALAIETP